MDGGKRKKRVRGVEGKSNLLERKAKSNVGLIKKIKLIKLIT